MTNKTRYHIYAILLIATICAACYLAINAILHANPEWADITYHALGLEGWKIFLAIVILCPYPAYWIWNKFSELGENKDADEASIKDERELQSFRAKSNIIFIAIVIFWCACFSFISYRIYISYHQEQEELQSPDRNMVTVEDLFKATMVDIYIEKIYDTNEKVNAVKQLIEETADKIDKPGQAERRYSVALRHLARENQEYAILHEIYESISTDFAEFEKQADEGNYMVWKTTERNSGLEVTYKSNTMQHEVYFEYIESKIIYYIDQCLSKQLGSNVTQSTPDTLDSEAEKYKAANNIVIDYFEKAIGENDKLSSSDLKILEDNFGQTLQYKTTEYYELCAEKPSYAHIPELDVRIVFISNHYNIPADAAKIIAERYDITEVDAAYLNYAEEYKVYADLKRINEEKKIEYIAELLHYIFEESITSNASFNTIFDIALKNTQEQDIYGFHHYPLKEIITSRSLIEKVMQTDDDYKYFKSEILEKFYNDVRGCFGYDKTQWKFPSDFNSAEDYVDDIIISSI